MLSVKEFSLKLVKPIDSYPLNSINAYFDLPMTNTNLTTIHAGLRIPSLIELTSNFFR